MNQKVNPALFPEALYSKSQVYILKGLRAKSANDLEEYQLWASMAIELLAKSSLSRVHPALVADPTHFQSLFAACGRPISPDIKTITAKTLYDRLKHISLKFDSRLFDFCSQLALRRNAEIHSGELPFANLHAKDWEKVYWYACEILLSLQDRDLDEWLGVGNSPVPKQILRDAEVALSMAVQTKIQHTQEDFFKNHRSLEVRTKLIQASKDFLPSDFYPALDWNNDAYNRHDCPACGAEGLMGGVLFSEEISDEYDPDNPLIEFVEKVYGVEEFICKVCNLHLSGVREIRAAGLDEMFYETEEREREYEPDYGND